MEEFSITEQAAGYTGKSVVAVDAARILSVTFSVPVRTASGCTCYSDRKIPVAVAELIPVPAGQVCIRIKIKSVQNNGYSSMFPAEFFTERQTFHRTLSAADVLLLVKSLPGTLFKIAVVRQRTCPEQDKTQTAGLAAVIHGNNFLVPCTGTAGKKRTGCSTGTTLVVDVITFRANKRGKVRIQYHQESKKPALTEENPENVSTGMPIGKTVSASGKQYILPEGVPIPFLVYLGVMTPAGKVVHSKYDKFRQINRFLEYIDDILPAVIRCTEPLSENRPLRVIDFGCGKSYLTFAIHYYLHDIRRLPVHITGLDLRQDVINVCSSLAGQLGCRGLEFIRGDIARYGAEYSSSKPDIMVALHACDTATDYALAYGVNHRCKAILSVPCCQHEANSLLKVDRAEQEFRPLLRHGLLKERFAALVTDAVRVSILEQAGYSVQVLEFIDMTHTPKNLLIRAVRKKNRSEYLNDGVDTITSSGTALTTDSPHQTYQMSKKPGASSGRFPATALCPSWNVSVYSACGSCSCQESGCVSGSAYFVANCTGGEKNDGSSAVVLPGQIPYSTDTELTGKLGITLTLQRLLDGSNRMP